MTTQTAHGYIPDITTQPFSHAKMDILERLPYWSNSVETVQAGQIDRITCAPDGSAGLWIQRHDRAGLMILDVSDAYMRNHKPSPGGYYTVNSRYNESYMPAIVFENLYTLYAGALKGKTLAVGIAMAILGLLIWLSPGLAHAGTLDVTFDWVAPPLREPHPVTGEVLPITPAEIAKYTIYQEDGTKVADIIGGQTLQTTQAISLSPGSSVCFQITATDTDDLESAKSPINNRANQCVSLSSAPPGKVQNVTITFTINTGS